MVNMEDVLENRPGGIIRCSAPNLYAAKAGICADYAAVLASMGLCAPMPRQRAIPEPLRSHADAMARMHAETMRGAKIGTWLLLALLVSVATCIADVSGFI